jgi:hypothetical protein
MLDARPPRRNFSCNFHANRFSCFVFGGKADESRVEFIIKESKPLKEEPRSQSQITFPCFIMMLWQRISSCGVHLPGLDEPR